MDIHLLYICEIFAVKMISKTTSITNEWAANALALNKDNSQVVIAGRSGKKKQQTIICLHNTSKKH